MKSAEQNLIDYLRENPEWQNSGSLQRMPFKNKNGSLATPRTLVRRLQENAEGDHAILEVKRTGLSTYYRIKQQHIKKVQRIVRIDSNTVRIEMVPVNAV